MDKVNLQELKADVPADVCFLWSAKLGKTEDLALEILCLSPFNNSGKLLCLLSELAGEVLNKNTRSLMEYWKITSLELMNNIAGGV